MLLTSGAAGGMAARTASVYAISTDRYETAIEELAEG
jgi:hypothetical protein